MDKKILPWLTAAAVAAIHTLVFYWLNIFAVNDLGGMLKVNSVYNAIAVAPMILTAAEYIWSGRRDAGRRHIYRFVQHNLFAIFFAYAGYAIYSLADLQEKSGVLSVTVYNAAMPMCISRYFYSSAAGLIVCIIISLAAKRNKNDRENA